MENDLISDIFTVSQKITPDTKDLTDLLESAKSCEKHPKDFVDIETPKLR